MNTKTYGKSRRRTRSADAVPDAHMQRQQQQSAGRCKARHKDREFVLGQAGQLRTTVKRRIAAGRAGEPYLTGISQPMAKALRRQGRR